MSEIAFERVVRYPFASTLSAAGGSPRLRLACAVEPGPAAPFVDADVVHPQRVARLLRAVGHVAAARFHVPPAMLERILEAADPIVTSGTELLRFESFSACAGVHARLDLLPGALRTRVREPGTTNVDLGADLRAALAGIGPESSMGLSVSADALRVDTPDGDTEERRVPLPPRWLSSLLEVAAVQRCMEHRLRIDRVEAIRFLRGLPSRGGRTPVHVVPNGRGLRLSARPAGEGVPLHGPDRLHVLRDLAPLARELHVWADPHGGSSAWVLDLGDEIFTLVLSPMTWRGFSGEGRCLDALASPARVEAIARVRAALRWQSELSPSALAEAVGASPEAVEAALAALAARGLVGYDLRARSYFHRVLPFDLDAVESLHPRLANARKLVADGAVRLLSDGHDAEVRGSGVTHRVHVGPDGARCTCPWHGRHGTERGPCKHLLAVSIRLDEEDGEGGRA